MGSSRLCKLAELFGVTVPYFFEGLPTYPSEHGQAIDSDLPLLVGFLATSEGQTLTRAFTRISDQKIRRALAAMVQQIADTHCSE